MHNKILIISFYSLILNTFFRPLNSTLAAWFGYITIIMGILYPIVRSKQNGKLLIDKMVFLLSIVLFISMVSSIGSFSINGIVNQVIAIISFIVFYWSLSINQTDKSFKNTIYIQDICKANYALCGILLLFGFGPFSFKYTSVGIWGHKMFSMGLGNPNVVSVYVMFSMVLLLIHVINQKGLIFRAFDFTNIVLLFYLLIELSSRTVVACVLFVIMGYIIGKRSNMMKYFWKFIIAWPIIMIMITLYIGVHNLGIQLLGKELETGRYSLYTSFISDFMSSPVSFVFGQVFKYHFTNLHNGPLTIIANIGIIGLFIYLWFWYAKIEALNANCSTKVQRIAIYAIIAFIIQSSSESLSMVGTIPYSIMIIIMDRIAKGEIINRNSYSRYRT